MNPEEYAKEVKESFRPFFEIKCPICGASLQIEKCKWVCKSPRCVNRVIENCNGD